MSDLFGSLCSVSAAELAGQSFAGRNATAATRRNQTYVRMFWTWRADSARNRSSVRSNTRSNSTERRDHVDSGVDAGVEPKAEHDRRSQGERECAVSSGPAPSRRAAQRTIWRSGSPAFGIDGSESRESSGVRTQCRLEQRTASLGADERPAAIEGGSAARPHHPVRGVDPHARWSCRRVRAACRCERHPAVRGRH